VTSQHAEYALARDAWMAGAAECEDSMSDAFREHLLHRFEKWWNSTEQIEKRLVHLRLGSRTDG
jgi:hypothetical protein